MTKKRITYKEKVRQQITEVLDYFWAFDWPRLEENYPFMNSRKWEIDYALLPLKIGIEYQGGVFMKGKSGHTNVAGQTRDWEKLNEAQIRGWIIICVNPKTIDNKTFIDQLRRAIKVKQGDIKYE